MVRSFQSCSQYFLLLVSIQKSGTRRPPNALTHFFRNLVVRLVDLFLLLDGNAGQLGAGLHLGAGVASAAGGPCLAPVLDRQSVAAGRNDDGSHLGLLRAKEVPPAELEIRGLVVDDEELRCPRLCEQRILDEPAVGATEAVERQYDVGRVLLELQELHDIIDILRGRDERSHCRPPRCLPEKVATHDK